MISRRRLVETALDVMKDKDFNIPDRIGKYHDKLIASIEWPEVDCLRFVLQVMMLAGVMSTPAYAPDAKPMPEGEETPF